MSELGKENGEYVRGFALGSGDEFDYSKTSELTVDDIDQIIAGLENWCKGPVEDPELDEVWDPYINKLKALRARTR